MADSGGLSPGQRRPETIGLYIVDDHHALREALGEHLAVKYPVEIVGEAGDAEEAMVGVAQTRPDVVLLDQQLPGRRGIDACPDLLAACPGVKIVIFTRFANRVLAQRSLAAGATGFAVKSITTDALWQAIRTVVAEGRYVDPEVNHRYGLTPQEVGTLALAAKGRTSPQIADALHLSPHTVDTYLKRAARKLGARNRIEATAIAARDGLV